MLSFINIVVIVILGCHIQEIQQNRLSTALEYANTYVSSFNEKNMTSIQQYWFLTGGVKHALVEHVKSEAENMANDIFNVNSENIVLDNMAKNTAENFVNLKKWLSNFDSENIKIVITTSTFHKRRAEKIFNGIFYDKPILPIWNLGTKSCSYCEIDEQFHILNVENDVRKALKL